MDTNGDFYTLKGYQNSAAASLTPAMEDYLEMIFRLLQEKEVVRIGELAQMLHVRPSSTSKMVQQLKLLGFIDSEKYGYVKLTKKGLSEGAYLLYRHKVLQDFLCALNHTKDELEQVEKIEHFLDRTTIKNLDALTRKLNQQEL